MTEQKVQGKEDIAAADRPFVDFYEVLQLSPRADSVTIERVYRLLAQRFHPNNKETGDQRAFEVVLAAYRTLKDPEQRAAYDAEYQNQQKLKWRVFDDANAAQGKRAAKEVRKGLISVLYTKRINELSNPGMTILEIEALTGCPREHLFVAAWYLREKGLLEVIGQGRYAVTAVGMDFCEEWEDGETVAVPEVSAANRVSSTAPQPPPQPSTSSESQNDQAQPPRAARGEPDSPQAGSRNGTQATNGSSSEAAARAAVRIQAAPSDGTERGPQGPPQVAVAVKPKAALNGTAEGQVMQSLRKLSTATLNPLPMRLVEVARPSNMTTLGELRPLSVFRFAKKRS